MLVPKSKTPVPFFHPSNNYLTIMIHVSLIIIISLLLFPRPSKLKQRSFFPHQLTMDPTRRIVTLEKNREELKAERERLKKLLVSDISEQENFAICQQIAASTAEITALTVEITELWRHIPPSFTASHPPSARPHSVPIDVLHGTPPAGTQGVHQESPTFSSYFVPHPLLYILLLIYEN